MTSATTILTMLAMLWHAMAGCCAHHVHEETPHQHENVAACQHDHGHPVAKHSEQDHCQHEDTSHDQHDHHGACNTTDCVFSLPDIGGELLGLTKAIGCEPYFDTACLISHNVAPEWLAYADPLYPDRLLLGSMRLHLQVQVLLI